MKPKINFLALLVLAASLSPTAWAGSTGTSTISYVQTYPDTANVYIKMTTAPTGKPGCSTSTSYDYVFALTDIYAKEMLSAVLTAHAAGRSVYTSGEGVCDVYSTAETVNYFRIQSN